MSEALRQDSPATTKSPDEVEYLSFALGDKDRSMRELEKAFWSHLDFWNRWVPFLTSSAFVWLERRFNQSTHTKETYFG